MATTEMHEYSPAAQNICDYCGKISAESALSARAFYFSLIMQINADRLAEQRRGFLYLISHERHEKSGIRSDYSCELGNQRSFSNSIIGWVNQLIQSCLTSEIRGYIVNPLKTNCDPFPTECVYSRPLLEV